MKLYTYNWYDRETGNKFNTISIVWDEIIDGKWEWEGNEYIKEIREFTEKEFFNTELI